MCTSLKVFNPFLLHIYFLLCWPRWWYQIVFDSSQSKILLIENSYCCHGNTNKQFPSRFFRHSFIREVQKTSIFRTYNTKSYKYEEAIHTPAGPDDKLQQKSWHINLLSIDSKLVIWGGILQRMGNNSSIALVLLLRFLFSNKSCTIKVAYFLTNFIELQ